MREEKNILERIYTRGTTKITIIHYNTLGHSRRERPLRTVSPPEKNGPPQGRKGLGVMGKWPGPPGTKRWAGRLSYLGLGLSKSPEADSAKENP